MTKIKPTTAACICSASYTIALNNISKGFADLEIMIRKSSRKKYFRSSIILGSGGEMLAKKIRQFIQRNAPARAVEIMEHTYNLVKGHIKWASPKASQRKKQPPSSFQQRLGRMNQRITISNMMKSLDGWSEGTDQNQPWCFQMKKRRWFWNIGTGWNPNKKNPTKSPLSFWGWGFSFVDIYLKVLPPIDWNRITSNVQNNMKVLPPPL